MKILLLHIFIFFQYSLLGQDTLLYNVFPVINGKVNYTIIYSVDSATKTKIFTKIKDWAVNSYSSQKATLEAEDKEVGYLAYKGFLPTIAHYEGGLWKGKPYQVDVYHTLKFYIKDEKVKMVFTDLSIVSHDLTSEVIANKSREDDKITVESWQQNIQAASGKRQTKLKDFYNRQATVLDKQFQAFLNGIKNDIIFKKSEFDF